MENQLKTFIHENTGGEIRVMLINEEPFFNLSDIGFALGQTKTNGNGGMFLRKERIASWCENLDIRGMSTVDTNIKITKKVDFDLIYVTEESFYDLCFESNTGKGKSLRKWVTEKVLPQIRKTGSYSTNEEHQITINANDLITMAKQLATVAGSQADVIKALESENKELKQRLQHKNTYHPSNKELETYTQMQLGIEGVPTNEDLIYTATEIAAELKMNAKSLNALLGELKIQFSINGTWILYAKYRDKGYTKTIKKHMYWTEAGKDFIKQKISESKIRGGERDAR